MSVAARVLLIEDHGIIREGLRLLLEQLPALEVAAATASGGEGITFYRNHWREPGIDLVLTDFSLPDLDGFAIVRRIKALNPAARILFLSLHRDPEQIGALLEAGASGYLLKQSAVQELSAAIQAVLADDIYLSPALATQLLGHLRRFRERQRHSALLTAREQEILHLLARGVTSRAIADQLGITPKTVENYRSRILGKLEATNTAAAVTIAFQHGLLPTLAP